MNLSESHTQIKKIVNSAGSVYAWLAQSPAFWALRSPKVYHLNAPGCVRGWRMRHDAFCREVCAHCRALAVPQATIKAHGAQIVALYSYDPKGRIHAGKTVGTCGRPRHV